MLNERLRRRPPFSPGGGGAVCCDEAGRACVRVFRDGAVGGVGEVPEVLGSSPESAVAWMDMASGSVGAEMGEVCRRSGFFLVRNHGVPTELIGRAVEETRRYARPYREKKEYAASRGSQFLGYRGVGQERSTTHAGGEACEQYRIGRTTNILGMDRPADFYHEPFGQCAALFEHLAVLGDELLSACAADFTLDSEVLKSAQPTPCTGWDSTTTKSATVMNPPARWTTRCPRTSITPSSPW
ncbi:2-oxoglutarate and iron-dependent oxygenase domain-containing protein [Streptomyces sp. NPDC006703]|uniref:2-oxoglutarate and iron-dependent oxygenase domain-containing protein n=1 Tax=Streptomyces sp. NPDC006703 TaxID=3364759 RepID=UPI0036A68EE2